MSVLFAIVNLLNHEPFICLCNAFVCYTQTNKRFVIQDSASLWPFGTLFSNYKYSECLRVWDRVYL